MEPLSLPLSSLSLSRLLRTVKPLPGAQTFRKLLQWRTLRNQADATHSGCVQNDANGIRPSKYRAVLQIDLHRLLLMLKVTCIGQQLSCVQHRSMIWPTLGRLLFTSAPVTPDLLLMSRNWYWYDQAKYSSDTINMFWVVSPIFLIHGVVLVSALAWPFTHVYPQSVIIETMVARVSSGIS